MHRYTFAQQFCLAAGRELCELCLYAFRVLHVIFITYIWFICYSPQRSRQLVIIVIYPHMPTILTTLFPIMVITHMQPKYHMNPWSTRLFLFYYAPKTVSFTFENEMVGKNEACPCFLTSTAPLFIFLCSPLAVCSCFLYTLKAYV